MCEMRLVDAAVLTGLPFVAAPVLSPASQYSMRILDTADGSWSTGMYFEESFSDSGEVVTPLHVVLYAASATQWVPAVNARVCFFWQGRCKAHVTSARSGSGEMLIWASKLFYTADGGFFAHSMALLNPDGTAASMTKGECIERARPCLCQCHVVVGTRRQIG